MNTTIDQLLTNVYELEGLLLVMQRHNDEVPQLVIDKFKEKAQHIAAQASIIDTIAQNAHTPEAEPVPPAFVPPTEHTDDSPAPAAAQPEQEPIIKPATPPKPSPKPLDEAKSIATTEPHSQLNGTPLRDITQAFSINDRFMFQRELFDGDKQKYSDAIAVMQRLASIDKIKDFITNDLGLDRSNEVVKEFVRLIELGLGD